MKRCLTFILLVWLATAAWSQSGPDPVKVSGFDLSDFRNLAIQQGGRLKPVDTFATESVRLITGKAKFQKADPVASVLCWWAGGESTLDQNLIEVRNLKLLEDLKLPAEQRWYSHKQLRENPKLRDLAGQLHGQMQNEKLSPELSAARDVLVQMRYLEMLIEGSAWTIIPNPSGINGPWANLGDLGDPNGLGNNSTYGPLKATLEALQKSVQDGNAAEFATRSQELHTQLEGLGPYPAHGQMARETHYNHLHPFRLAYVFYLVALVLLVFAARAAGPMYWAGLACASTGFALHAYGFYLRCMIAGRPPVTNMYESVIWVAFGAVLFSLMFEFRYRARVYLLASTVGAVVCLILADTLPAVLDPSIRPLTPVLRSNFWLTIHVLTITLGYAAFLLSLGLGHMVVFKYITGPDRKEEIRGLNKALYKALQVGVLLLAAGTLLGGVWANYSWGRFWGWDPKEVWALIALLGYLAILHGRYAGWLGNYGTAACSILAFQGVLMAWYGVNFVLGAGLHSYGFGTGGVRYVAIYVGFEVLFVALATLRYRKLRSQD